MAQFDVFPSFPFKQGRNWKVHQLIHVNPPFHVSIGSNPTSAQVPNEVPPVPSVPMSTTRFRSGFVAMENLVFFGPRHRDMFTFIDEDFSNGNMMEWRYTKIYQDNQGKGW
jgi:hypothetical protein